MSTGEHWRRIERILERVLEAPPEDAARILAQECGSDRELRRRVAAMLAAGDDPSFLSRPAVRRLALPDSAPARSTRTRER